MKKIRSFFDLHAHTYTCNEKKMHINVQNIMFSVFQEFIIDSNVHVLV